MTGKPNLSPTAIISTPNPRPIAADADCGPRALLLICQQMHKPADLSLLRRTAGTNTEGTTLEGLAKAARSIGLRAEGVQMDKNALAHLQGAAIAWVDGNHYVAVLGVHHNPLTGTDTATLFDPNQSKPVDASLETLLSRSGGILLTLQKEKPS